MLLRILWLTALGAVTHSAGTLDLESPAHCTSDAWAAPRDQRLCRDRHLCNENNKTWPLPRCRPPLFETDACDLLRARGITEIYFMGDSYMRHIYQAAIITLTGNYRDGSVEGVGDLNCTYRNQYSNKECSNHRHVKEPLVCNGTIRLELSQYGPLSPKKIFAKKGSVSLLSYGNHQSVKGRGARYGIHNATAWLDVLDKWHCAKSRGEQQRHVDVYDGMKHVWWVSTHARITGFFPDEHEAVVTKYNLEMRDTLPSVCPTFGYIDVFNMTHALTQNPTEHHGLSYDKVHWGLEVNLNKWQIIQDILIQTNGSDSTLGP